MKFGGNIIMVALLLVSILMVVVYTREGESGPLHTVQGYTSVVAAPFSFAGSGIGAAAGNAADAVSDASADDASYHELKQENAELREQLAQLEEYKVESERLQGLLAIQDQYSLVAVTGQVIGRSTDAWNRVVTVGAGSSKGVALGDAVVGSTGLVGQVIAVTPLTCDVRLLADQQSGVAVMIQSNREQGILRGSLEGLLYLENVDASIQVSQGDVIITSGMGGSYPKGIVVGTVTNVENPAGTADRRIVVTPLSSADPLEELSVVKSADAADSDSADAAASAEGGEE